MICNIPPLGSDTTPFEHSKYVSGVKPGEDITTKATQSSCLKNREFILTILKNYLTEPKLVFEVGTGTADQTVYFCENLPNVIWQTSDRQTYHTAIQETLKKASLLDNRVKDPVVFDIDSDEIEKQYDCVYASNVIHCIPWHSAKLLFKKASSALKADGLFILYGPYNIKHPSHIDGQFTSEGNKKFDQKLKLQDSTLGLREIGEVTALAKENGLNFVAKHDHTAANNYILVFKKAVLCESPQNAEK